MSCSHSFVICPKCRIGYDLNNIEFLEHLNECDDSFEEITTKFYTKQELINIRRNKKKPVIDVDLIQRPFTR